MENTDRNVTIKLMFIGLFMLGSIFHIFQWNEHSFAIIPLKIKDLAGIAEKQDYINMAKICEDRKRPTCVEMSVYSALRKDTKDIKLMYKLSQIKMERKAYTDTVKLMAEYFRSGGDGEDQRYLLSQALFYSGDTISAEKQLHYILYSSKKRVHPDIARFYVKVLMNNKKWKTAHQAIMYYRSRVKNASYFMKDEFKVIQKNLSKRRS